MHFNVWNLCRAVFVFSLPSLLTPAISDTGLTTSVNEAGLKRLCNTMNHFAHEIAIQVKNSWISSQFQVKPQWSELTELDPCLLRHFLFQASQRIYFILFFNYQEKMVLNAFYADKRSIIDFQHLFQQV